jgi:ASCH domain
MVGGVGTCSGFFSPRSLDQVQKICDRAIARWLGLVRYMKSDMRALSIRQPWAELILLGHKTIEVRSKATHLRERIYIYAGHNRIEAEEEARIAAQFDIDVDGLPRGVLVGTVEIIGCRPVEKSDSEGACFEIDDGTGFHAWVLDRPKRAEVLEKATRQPQPMFFNPF